MRSGVAVVSLIAAVVGGLASVLVAKGTGWLGETRTIETIVVREAAPADRGAARLSTAKPLSGNGFDPAAIYASRAAGVVTIDAYFDPPQSPTARASQGSGFVVSPRGYILTNSHVITTAGEGNGAVTGARYVYIQFSDRDRVAGRIVGWDVFTDVGLVKVDPKGHPLTPVPLGDSSRVRVGEPVATIGSPFGNETSLAVGVVSATRRSIESLTSRYTVVDAIQTDAPINRGNSGGPLFDARGRVIGINAQIRSSSGNAEGVGFAIPINTARRSMQQLITDGRVRYAYVGIKTEDVTPTLARELGYGASNGAAVASVEPNSPAARAGLRGSSREVFFNGNEVGRGGDLIVAINGEPVRTSEDLVRIVSTRLVPGQVARFTVLRGKQRRQIRVRLVDRPAGDD
jgi:2-alkenal reductase